MDIWRWHSMEYIKLLVLKVTDFESSIVSEKNYKLQDDEIISVDKRCWENEGYTCVTLKMKSNLVV